MLIYAAADIHGDRRRIGRLQQSIAAHQPDVLVLAGDLSRRWQPQTTLSDLDRLGVPVMLVRGNSDSRRLNHLLTSYPRLQSIHQSKMHIGGVDFIGVDGTLPMPFHSRLALREAPIVVQLSSMLQTDSVFVTHPPPYGARDRLLGRFHAGSRGVRRLVDRCSPALVLCGHIHEQTGVTRIGKTVVVNCSLGTNGGGALIHYDGRSEPQCRLLVSGE